MEKLARNNCAFVLDALVARLAFERTGVTLYDGAIDKIERSADPRFQPIVGQLRHIRDEEQEHATWLEQQIRALGGNPDEKTDLAELEVEEGAGIKSVIVDGHQQPIHVVHALLAAELADNAGWDVLVKLADEAGDSEAKAAFARRLAEEAKHLLFVREVVLRAVEAEIGRAQPMPSDLRGVASARLAKPLAIGGAVAALLFGAGALAGSLLGAARRRRRPLRFLTA